MLTQIRTLLKSYSKTQKKGIVSRYFKTGKGDYAEDDIFIEVTMPQIKLIEKQFRQKIKMEDIKNLLTSKIHEERRLALLFMTNKFNKAKDQQIKKDILKIYKEYVKYINNWDLVDVSAPHIIGQSILEELQTKQILYQYAKSDNLWKRRISIVSTHQFIKQGLFLDTLKLSKLFLDDSQDLMHKACGWMLREVGKKNEQILLEFLDEHSIQMPRVMLRYSIEKLDPELRKHYLNKKVQFFIYQFIYMNEEVKSDFFTILLSEKFKQSNILSLDYCLKTFIDHYDNLVSLRYYQDEIIIIIDLFVQYYFLNKHNSLFGEYFYSMLYKKRKKKQYRQKINYEKKIIMFISIFFRKLFIQKIKKYQK